MSKWDYDRMIRPEENEEYKKREAERTREFKRAMSTSGQSEKEELSAWHNDPAPPDEEAWLVLFKADGDSPFHVTPFEHHEKAEKHYKDLAASWSDLWLCKVEKKNHVG